MDSVPRSLVAMLSPSYATLMFAIFTDVVSVNMVLQKCSPYLLWTIVSHFFTHIFRVLKLNRLAFNITFLFCFTSELALICGDHDIVPILPK